MERNDGLQLGFILAEFAAISTINLIELYELYEEMNGKSDFTQMKIQQLKEFYSV